MQYQSPAKARDAAQFRERWRAIDPTMDCDLELEGALGPLRQPLDVAGFTLTNRFAIHPMEGWDAERDGRPSARTLRRWRRFGCSGADLIWGGEAFAVQEDGRANPNQLYLNDAIDVEAGLAELRAALVAGRREIGWDPDKLVTGLQLTHSGRFSRPQPEGRAPRIAFHHPVLDEHFAIGAECNPLTDGELESIGENFVRAAKLAQRAGFDFVDVKNCHGYLLHELLGATTRPGPYGGSFANRTRLFRRIVEAIRNDVPGLAIGVRVSIVDSHPYRKDAVGVGTPWDWERHVPWSWGFGVDRDDPREPDFGEPFQFLELLRALDIRLVNLSVGSPYYCPHLQRPATYPPSDGYLPPEDPLHGVAYQIRAVRTCKRTFPDLTFVGSGYTYLQEFLPHVAQHEVRTNQVDLVGLGRMVLSYPTMPRDVLEGRTLQRKLICRTFSDCTTGPRLGLPSGCYPLDEEYKRTPEAAELKTRKRDS